MIMNLQGSSIPGETHREMCLLILMSSSQEAGSLPASACGRKLAFPYHPQKGCSSLSATTRIYITRS